MQSYPYNDGDTTVLGPEVFVSADGSVISWQGRNYIPQGSTHTQVPDGGPDRPEVRPILTARQTLLDLARLSSLVGWDDKMWDLDEDWGDLQRHGLMTVGSDQSGERFPVITDKGRERLAELVKEVVGG